MENKQTSIYENEMRIEFALIYVVDIKETVFYKGTATSTGVTRSFEPVI